MKSNRSLQTAPCMLLLVTSLLLGAGAPGAQSGRCVMEGFVVGESDYPGISGATVELIGDPETARSSVKLSATTDGVGKYSLKEVPYGRYTLRVTAPGYDAYEIPVYMLSDTTTQLHIKLRKLG